MKKKVLPIGTDNFKKLMDNDCYYVDKSMIIKELLDSKLEVVLFTRPRRFGKTLLQSMLKTFFEKEICMIGDHAGEIVDNSSYFKELNIMNTGYEYTSKQGQYPVISFSLKSAKQPDYEMAYESILDEISREFKRHRYVLKSNALLDDEKKKYERIMSGEGSRIEYAKALLFLSECLHKYSAQKVIILIDEYDVPLENAYFHGFYDKMAGFIRSLFESALKTNENLEFSVITGCLRISKESIFTGLNNLEMVSILNNKYDEYFGFVPQEVKEMLSYYKIEEKYEEAKNWYDGYLFGDTEVYNPWSIVNYVNAILVNYQVLPVPYWSNTSSNSIVKELVESADAEVKNDIEILIQGGMLTKLVHEDITYEDIYKSKDNLWNFLFFTGYLKKVSEQMIGEDKYLTMCIPNAEVRSVYRNTIYNWVTESLEKKDMSALIFAIENGDCEKIQCMIEEQLMETISYNDYKEDYYHGFLAGLLKSQKKYLVLSNRESGTGRYDLVLKERRFAGNVYILELKVADSYGNMPEKCEEALNQIEVQKYEKDFLNEGYKIAGRFGIAFMKKGCLVRER